MKIIEVESATLADRYARSHARDKGAAPHGVRCNHLRLIEGVSYRCLQAEGHSGRHTFVDAAEHDAGQAETAS